MALGATVHRFRIELSHVDRGLYEALDLRVARHPSESPPFLITRVLAYCVCFTPDLELGRGGVSSTDEPALWARDPTGRPTLWIEVGVPSAERVHKASKSSERVAVFAHRDPVALFEDAAKRKVHHAAEIDVYALDPSLLAALETALDRNNDWGVVIHDGRIYVSVGDQTHQAELIRRPLGQTPT